MKTYRPIPRYTTLSPGGCKAVLLLLGFAVLMGWAFLIMLTPSEGFKDNALAMELSR